MDAKECSDSRAVSPRPYTVRFTGSLENAVHIEHSFVAEQYFLIVLSAVIGYISRFYCYDEWQLRVSVMLTFCPLTVFLTGSMLLVLLALAKLYFDSSRLIWVFVQDG